MKTRLITFVKDFTDTPGGRYRIHGDFSGEEFRDGFLIPALNENDRVIVDLNGAYGFPSSFIDEAFGILVSQIGYEAVKQKLILILDDDPVAKTEIQECMKDHCA